MLPIRGRFGSVEGQRELNRFYCSFNKHKEFYGKCIIAYLFMDNKPLYQTHIMLSIISDIYIVYMFDGMQKELARTIPF